MTEFLFLCRHTYRWAVILIIIIFAVCFLPLYYTSIHLKSQQDKGSIHPLANQLRNSSTTNSDKSHKYGYVVGMIYSGQQGAGVQALMSLQCFIGSFGLPMQILEPVISSTKFESYHSIDNQSLLTSFSDMFDITHFNIVSENAGLASLVTMKDFVVDAPKVTILVVTIRHQASYGRQKRVSSVSIIWSSENTSLCYQLNNTMLSVRKFTQSGGFCIKRVVSVIVFPKSGNSFELFNKADLYDKVFGPFYPHDVTLIFSEWRTPWYVANSSHVASKCQEMKLKSKKAQFRPSPQLLADVKYYKERFLNSSNSLAVMLRLERMLLLLKKRENIEKEMKKCLDEVVSTASDIWQRKNQRGIPMVTLDLGKYGSGSWVSSMDVNKFNWNMIMKLAKDTLSTLFNSQWGFEEWERSFIKAARRHENSGYIAAVQRTLASQAECLVLAGGGNFQELAMRDYMRNHPNKGSWCIHLVCAVNQEQLQTEIIQSMTTLMFNDL